MSGDGDVRPPSYQHEGGFLNRIESLFNILESLLSLFAIVLNGREWIFRFFPLILQP